MPSNDPSKRVPKSLGTDAKLLGTYSMTDLAVALVPGVLVILLFQTVLPSALTVLDYRVQALTLPLAGVAILCGAVFVSFTPSHMTSLDWLVTFVGFHRSERQLDHEAAKEYTHVERVYPRQDAIERTDGALIAMLQVEPPTMALATDEEWRQKATSFQDFCNTVVEFPIQIYSTTRDFPVEEYLAQYESRLSDSDVTANPRLEALIENYVEWYERELHERRMTIRDHYVIVSVAPEDVQFDSESLLRGLTGLPVLGLFVRAWLAPAAEEERAAMFEALEERTRRVEGGLRDIEGCGAHVVGAEEAAMLIGEFWAGESLEYHDLDRVFRTRPIVGGRT